MVTLCNGSVWWLCVVARTVGWKAIGTLAGKLEVKAKQADPQSTTEWLWVGDEAPSSGDLC